MSLPKILVAAPTSDKKDYCFDEWIDRILSLDYANYDILIVDNSHNPTYYHKILNKGVRCIHVEPKGNVVDYITYCQNIIRECTIKGGYHALVSIESDVFVSPEIISHLVHHSKPVVTAPYFVQYKGGDPTICWMDATEQFIEDRIYVQTELLGTEDTLHRLNGELVQVFACGIGCTLIHWEVLELIKFRSGVRENEKRVDRSVFSDSLFYLDCKRKGIPCYLDTSLLVEHKYSGWDSNLDLYIN